MFLKQVLWTVRASQGGGPWLSLGKLPRVAMTMEEPATGVPGSGRGCIVTCQLPSYAFQGLQAGTQEPGLGFRSQRSHSLAGGFMYSLTTPGPLLPSLGSRQRLPHGPLLGGCSGTGLQ